MLHRFEIHSALELSRPALLGCCFAALRRREAARWQLPWDVLIYFNRWHDSISMPQVYYSSTLVDYVVPGISDGFALSNCIVYSPKF